MTTSTKGAAALALIPGATLRHLGADPAQTYVASRDSGALRAAGAIDAETAELVAAIDGLTGDGRDGRLQVTEIEAALAPERAATFEPARRALLPRLLDALAWPEVKPASPAPAALPPLVAEDVSIAPGSAGDPRREPTARARVPMPGVVVLPLLHDGNTVVSLVAETAVREEVTSTRHLGSVSRDRAATLKVLRTAHVAVNVPEGHRAVLIALPALEEQALAAGRHALQLAEGTHRIELYAEDAPTGAAPLEASEVEIPAFRREEEADLGAYLGFTLVGDDGVRLHRNLVDTSIFESSSLGRPLGGRCLVQQRYGEQRASYVWSLTRQAPRGDVEVAAALEPLRPSIRPGRYEAHLEPRKPRRGERIVVDVFPEGVVKVHRGGKTQTLRPIDSRRHLACDDAAILETERLWFDVKSGHISGYSSARQQVDAILSDVGSGAPR
jgi:hypothetical protein